MTLPVEGMSSEQSQEKDRRDGLRWEISQLLGSSHGIFVPLYADEKDGRKQIIKIMGGWMKPEGHSRHAEIGLVNIDYLDLLSGESTTISIDERQYKVDGSDALRIDEHQDNPDEEEDVIGTMLGVVTPLPNGGTVRWDHLLSGMKALEQLEIHPDWHR
jgi:hypothetical protein